METGNPKQLAVLSVMAVGAIGFLVIRLGSRSQTPTVQATVAARQEGKISSFVAFNMARDPFSHPKLAPVETKAAQEGAFIVSKPVGLGSPVASFGPLPDAPAPTGFEGPVVPVASPKPASKPEPKPLTTIGLEAIAGASDSVAFLSVGGADSQPFHPKDSVAGAIRLLRVGDGTVVLEGPNGRVTLEVGERKSL